MPVVRNLHIMTKGDQISNDGDDIKVNDQMLTDLEQTFNPQVHDVPVILGHSSDSEEIMSDKIPAFAWLLDVRKVGPDLFADMDASDELMEFIEKGFYKKRSLAFYPADSRINPHNQKKTAHQGKPTLRHLALLGGAPPAVKGLKDIVFSEDVSFATVEMTVKPQDLEFQEEDEEQPPTPEAEAPTDEELPEGEDIEPGDDELSSFLTENAVGWITFLLEDGEDSFTGGIAEILPTPAEENLWLFDPVENGFIGQFRDINGTLYDFRLLMAEDGTVKREFELVDKTEGEQEDEATPEEETVEAGEEGLKKKKGRKKKVTEEIEEMADGTTKTKRTEETIEPGEAKKKEVAEFKEQARQHLEKSKEFLEKARQRVSRPADEEDDRVNEQPLGDREKPLLTTDKFQEPEEEPPVEEETLPAEGEGEANEVSAEAPEEEPTEELQEDAPIGDGQHVHDEENPEGEHKHEDLNIGIEIMNEQIADLQAQITALKEQNTLLAEENIGFRDEALIGFAETLYKGPDGAKLTEAVIPQEKLVESLKVLSEIKEEDKVVSFGEGETATKQTPLEVVQEILVNLPVMVKFGEVAPESEPQPELKIPAPAQGLVYDEERAAEFAEIQAYAKKHKVGFGEAYKAMREEDNA